MKRTDPFLLADILDAIIEIQENTPSQREDFFANKLVQSHVLRHIQIFGEAGSSKIEDGRRKQSGDPGSTFFG